MPKIVDTRAGRFVGVPFELDLLDQDLDAHFPDFAEGQPVMWGVALAALEQSWDTQLRLDGVDWEIRLYPPGGLAIPKTTRGANKHIRMVRVKQHAALLVIATPATNLNGARDFGRRAVRSLVAIARRELPYLVPAGVLWEGAIVNIGPSKSKMSMTEVHMTPTLAVTDRRLRDTRRRMVPFAVGKLPGHVLRALEWLTLARSARVRPEKFIHLWLSVLALASYKQPKRDDDMKRITRYTSTMSSGVGGVRSPLSVTQLNERFRKASSARHALIHRDDDSKITLELLYDLEAAAFELIDFELAKLGIHLAAPTP